MAGRYSKYTTYDPANLTNRMMIIVAGYIGTSNFV